MELNDILNALQYSKSPNFLAGMALESDRDFGRIFRKAQAECKLQGVYALNGSSYDRGGIKGTGYFFHVAIAGGCVMDPCHAKNPARAAGWICLSCDQPVPFHGFSVWLNKGF